jgi:hypothetical protein
MAIMGEIMAGITEKTTRIGTSHGTPTEIIMTAGATGREMGREI